MFIAARQIIPPEFRVMLPPVTPAGGALLPPRLNSCGLQRPDVGPESACCRREPYAAHIARHLRDSPRVQTLNSARLDSVFACLRDFVRIIAAAAVGVGLFQMRHRLVRGPESVFPHTLQVFRCQSGKIARLGDQCVDMRMETVLLSMRQFDCPGRAENTVSESRSLEQSPVALRKRPQIRLQVVSARVPERQNGMGEFQRNKTRKRIDSRPRLIIAVACQHPSADRAEAVTTETRA